MSNLFENVSLTRRAREGACGAHRGPMPPSAVGLLRPVPAAAAWLPHAGPPAPGLTGTEEVQERPWEPPLESDGGGSAVCRFPRGQRSELLSSSYK